MTTTFWIKHSEYKKKNNTLHVVQILNEKDQSVHKKSPSLVITH